MVFLRLKEYLQYHWCPWVIMFQNLIFLELSSSSIYSTIKEGMAIITRMIAGINVHNSSKVWASITVLLILNELCIIIMFHITAVIIIIRINLTKS